MGKSAAQVQLDALLLNASPEWRGAPHELVVPQAAHEFVAGKSSRGKKVLLPTWVVLGGVKFVKLERFPNAQGAEHGAGAHSGAHGCVAAYQVAPEWEHMRNVAGVPARLALKCVPYGPKRKALSSPWWSEWRIHDYLRTCGVRQRNEMGTAGPEAGAGASPFVACLGGVAAPVGRSTQVFVALELMDTDLFTMIERSSSTKHFGTWILRALLSTCHGIDYMHQNGITYCDLKPENVLVDIDSARAAFGDFDRSCIPEIKVGVVGGTKGYYSPERMRNPSVHTHADDAWAFGVLMLIGATTAASPYLEYDASNVHRFVPSKYVKRYSRCGWAPAVVQKVGALCDRVLCVDPAARAPLDQVADVLAECLGLQLAFDGAEPVPASQPAPIAASVAAAAAAAAAAATASAAPSLLAPTLSPSPASYARAPTLTPSMRYEGACSSIPPGWSHSSSELLASRPGASPHGMARLADKHWACTSPTPSHCSVASSRMSMTSSAGAPQPQPQRYGFAPVSPLRNVSGPLPQAPLFDPIFVQEGVGYKRQRSDDDSAALFGEPQKRPALAFY